jgi:NADPH:quinone reductase-like Zn-dependent oxidoreductase
MKAAIYTRYGPPSVVQIVDVEKPIPKGNEVLIKVRVASVNPLDWHFMRGMPYFLRIAAGLRKPKDKRLGADVAGQVEAAGKNVTQFRPGAEVFGVCRGAFAEYACASESKLVLKPDNVTFEQAASAPVAAFTALQGLRDKGHLQPGHKVLINGAAGGVGTFTVQIAKSFGAEVTGVCSTRNLDMVRSIGADHVIDYIREDFTKSGQRYDLIFDCVGNHSLFACRRVLNSNGIYIGAGGSTGWWMIGTFARAITMPMMSRVASQKLVMILANPNKEDLTIIGELMKAGRVTPVIDRRYGLDEVPEAIRYLEEGHARGKVIITLA